MTTAPINAFHRVIFRPDGSLNLLVATWTVAFPALVAALGWALLGHQDVADLQTFLRASIVFFCFLSVRSIVGVIVAVRHGPVAPAPTDESAST